MSVNRTFFRERILRYVPEISADWVTEQVFLHGIGLTIKKGRKSKLGDYRAPFQGKGHRISINFELNKDEFLVTFVHELAHLICFEKYKNKVKPHGPEWKRIYADLLKQCTTKGYFSEYLLPALLNHIDSPGATSCSDPVLRQALAGEENAGKPVLFELAEGTKFKLGKMAFEKGPLQRTRYRCLNLANNRYYLVQKHAPVEILKNEG